jgi:hypothetical protein
MKCIICKGDSDYYFTKDFNSSELNTDRLFMLGKVEYFRCTDCGFVFSRTHAEMDESIWEKLNKDFHTYGEKPNNLKEHNPPPYLEQAIFLKILQENLIISNNILDWGGGYGTLAKILMKYFNIHIKVYDKYMQAAEPNGVDYVLSGTLTEQSYGTVFSSAVFEHVTKREYLEEINNCVSKDGCLIIHTVVCEQIPKDPKWFYLGAVHCAFHTNKSMDLLMKQWGYKSSIYCPLAKSWVLFKKVDSSLEKLTREINKEVQTQYLYYKKGFMDYWK